MASTTASVCLPIDPVEPRMEICFKLAAPRISFGPPSHTMHAGQE
jgi:hypothetical protein